MTEALLPIARAYWQAGLTPLPRLSGRPEPSYVDDHGQEHSIPWGSYKAQQPPWEVVSRWCAGLTLDTAGVVLLPGASAYPKNHEPVLQILDIESPDVWEGFQDACSYGGLAEILYRCVTEQTPSGGGHLGFLSTAVGNEQKQKLARRKADGKVLIELLQHQPCTVAPTRIRCKPTHPPDGAYTLLHGTWREPLTISPDQRSQLLRIAQSFDECPKALIHPAGKGTPGTRPGDVLGEKADRAWWDGLLSKHGWRDVSRPGLAVKGITYWQRPGKVGNAPSATLGACGPYFYCFTSNGAPFEPDKAYSPFAAYTLLDHGGDFHAAAQQLAHDFQLSPPRSAPRRGLPPRLPRLHRPLRRIRP